LFTYLKSMNMRTRARTYAHIQNSNDVITLQRADISSQITVVLQRSRDKLQVYNLHIKHRITEIIGCRIYRNWKTVTYLNRLGNTIKKKNNYGILGPNLVTGTGQLRPKLYSWRRRRSWWWWWYDDDDLQNFLLPSLD